MKITDCPFAGDRAARYNTNTEGPEPLKHGKPDPRTAAVAITKYGSAGSGSVVLFFSGGAIGDEFQQGFFSGKMERRFCIGDTGNHFHFAKYGHATRSLNLSKGKENESNGNKNTEFSFF